MLGTRIAVLLFSADSVEKLLSSSVNIEKSSVYEGIQEWLGMGLLTRYLMLLHFPFINAKLAVWLQTLKPNSLHMQKAFLANTGYRCNKKLTIFCSFLAKSVTRTTLAWVKNIMSKSTMEEIPIIPAQ